MDDVVTKPISITGTASDENKIHSYKLMCKLEGQNDDAYKLIIESDKEVKEDALGELDPTLLSNGRYEIKLIVKDKGGNTASAVRTVMVDGKLKVGVMNIGFCDITNKLSGITVNVNRMYSSMNKSTSGDFGYGVVYHIK